MVRSVNNQSDILRSVLWKKQKRPADFRTPFYFGFVNFTRIFQRSDFRSDCVLPVHSQRCIFNHFRDAIHCPFDSFLDGNVAENALRRSQKNFQFMRMDECVNWVSVVHFIDNWRKCGECL